jgi:hypothetical protein
MQDVRRPEPFYAAGVRRPLLLVAAAVLVGCAGGTTGTTNETGTVTTNETGTVTPALRTADAPEATTVIESAEPSVASDPGGEPIVIRTTMVIAAEEGAEPIATGEVLEGSTLGGTPFCAGGTILDSHASLDPAVEPLGLIDRMITCSDGTVRIVFTPEGVPQGQTQTGSWTMVSGTGAFEGLRGDGAMEVVYDPDDDSLGLETLSGTVTR